MANKFQNATPNGPSNTITDVWLTPQWIIDKIGDFDLDPCGHLPNGNPIVRTAKNFFTEEENGLIQDWYGNVFVNFPYSDGKVWMEKCKSEYLKGNVKNIIVLCFARTETQAWQQNVNSCTGINLINKRIKFLDQEGIERGNGNAPSCLIAWGEEAYQKIKNIDGLYFRIDN